MRWQKRARLAVAIFGIAFAVVVYSAIGDRKAPLPAPPPQRVDPAATIETSRGVLNRVTGAKLDFAVAFERNLSYENGVTRLIGVRIDVKEKQGRDFVITSGEAYAGERQEDLQLSERVRMAASDGFVLETATATFNQTEGIVRTPGPVSFSKGGMSGGGLGMTYDKNTDVLTVLEQAHVRMVDEAGVTTGEFSAGKATFSRNEDYLLLEGAVHAVRGDQTIDADRARAILTPDEKAMTAIELRGNARVAGGSAGFDSMRARDIDMLYADDGRTIERVVLTGSGAIALKGRSAASGQAASGQQLLGGRLDVSLAPDGAVTSASGQDGVQLDLPASADSAGRHVTARTLDASGEPGKGMTAARFTGDVEYREEATADRPARLARSRALQVRLDGDAVTGAVFTGRVQFEEAALRASAAEARYDPGPGTLRLEGAEGGRPPRVADDRIAIEADRVDVTLAGRAMLADGAVKTVLRPQSKTPGLLKRGEPANVSAGSLRYDGDASRAVYTGGAQLWQGDTAIRGETIRIDQQSGGLSAAGGATSTLAMGADTSIGRADEIAYDDGRRQIVYTTSPTTAEPSAGAASMPRAPAGVPAAGTPAPRAPSAGASTPGVRVSQLSGPQGDLKAARIVVHLAKEENRMERLDARGAVTLHLDARVATGDQLTYFASDERYVLAGSAAAPVNVVEPCRDTTGKTLTFFKSTDRIIVDGNEEIRTRTRTGGPCPETRPE